MRLVNSTSQYIVQATLIRKGCHHLFSTKRKTFIKDGGPAGAIYESGWMDANYIFLWFQKLFLPAVSHLTRTAPVVLFFDGHYSHISIAFHQTLQPLDVGVFAPLKNAWCAVLKLETRGKYVS